MPVQSFSWTPPVLSDRPEVASDVPEHVGDYLLWSDQSHHRLQSQSSSWWSNISTIVPTEVHCGPSNIMTKSHCYCYIIHLSIINFFKWGIPGDNLSKNLSRMLSKKRFLMKKSFHWQNKLQYDYLTFDLCYTLLKVFWDLCTILAMSRIFIKIFLQDLFCFFFSGGINIWLANNTTTPTCPVNSRLIMSLHWAEFSRFFLISALILSVMALSHTEISCGRQNLSANTSSSL